MLTAIAGMLQDGGFATKGLRFPDTLEMFLEVNTISFPSLDYIHFATKLLGKYCCPS